MIAPALATIDAVAATTPPAWAAAAGMLIAPAGSWLGRHVPPRTPMAALGGLMLLIAAMDVFRAVGTSLFVMKLVGAAAAAPIRTANLSKH